MNAHELNKLSKKIIGIAINVHKVLGPGFVEKVYSKALEIELKEEKIDFIKERSIRVVYKDHFLGEHKLDYLIENELVLELKAVPEINKAHEAQLLSYLKVSNKRLGLILNFGKPTLEIKRLVYRF